MKNFTITVLVLSFCVVLFSCSGKGVKTQLAPRDQYNEAMEYYNKGKYFKAQMNLQKIIYSYPGQTFIDTAQFYLGMSLYEMGNRHEAIGEFHKLLSAYPVSDFADDAYYQIGECYFEESPHYALDQEDTYSAIDEFSMFINKFPNSPFVSSAREKLNLLYDKLAKKMYKNGELYLKIGSYEPALEYFQQVRDNYPNTEWAKYAFYYSGEAQMKIDKTEEAIQTFENFVITFPDHKLAKKARRNIEKLKDIRDGS